MGNGEMGNGETAKWTVTSREAGNNLYLHMRRLAHDFNEVHQAVPYDHEEEEEEEGKKEGTGTGEPEFNVLIAYSITQRFFFLVANSPHSVAVPTTCCQVSNPYLRWPLSANLPGSTTHLSNGSVHSPPNHSTLPWMSEVVRRRVNCSGPGEGSDRSRKKGAERGHGT